ncbi:2'-5' RNA ligase family protein [Nocardioides nanhaiensis]|uniref:2'-5' RNA ligase family protein n=1 Tax=Nocardioides nanhaiensis TaxID=1476871 RepID=A0ABP8WFK3_9ACTN
MSGHTVLVVPVPALQPFVRERTARYDASFLSADPGFVNAHITLLGPWLPEPGDVDLATVGRIAAAQPAFDYRLARVEGFPDGVLHLPPSPGSPFRRLTAALVQAFPETPPYRGEFPDTVPHLTLDHASTGATVASLTAELALPVTARADRVDLQWWANHDCHVRASWPLGGPGAAA